MKFITRAGLALGIALLSSLAFSCETCIHAGSQANSDSNKIKIEAACFVYGAHDDPAHQGSLVVLQYYFDPLLNDIVGAFVRINESKEPVPLVLKEVYFESKENPGGGNFEITWLEAFDGKITGSYKFILTGMGSRPGYYLEYRSFKSNKKYLLSHHGKANSCASLSEQWKNLRVLR